MRSSKYSTNMFVNPSSAPSFSFKPVSLWEENYKSNPNSSYTPPPTAIQPSPYHPPANNLPSNNSDDDHEEPRPTPMPNPFKKARQQMERQRQRFGADYDQRIKKITFQLKERENPFTRSKKQMEEKRYKNDVFGGPKSSNIRQVQNKDEQTENIAESTQNVGKSQSSLERSFTYASSTARLSKAIHRCISNKNRDMFQERRKKALQQEEDQPSRRASPWSSVDRPKPVSWTGNVKNQSPIEGDTQKRNPFTKYAQEREAARKARAQEERERRKDQALLEQLNTERERGYQVEEVRAMILEVEEMPEGGGQNVMGEDILNKTMDVVGGGVHDYENDWHRHAGEGDMEVENMSRTSMDDVYNGNDGVNQTNQNPYLNENNNMNLMNTNNIFNYNQGINQMNADNFYNEDMNMNQMNYDDNNFNQNTNNIFGDNSNLSNNVSSNNNLNGYINFNWINDDFYNDTDENLNWSNNNFTNTIPQQPQSTSLFPQYDNPWALAPSQPPYKMKATQQSYQSSLFAPFSFEPTLATPPSLPPTDPIPFLLEFEKETLFQIPVVRQRYRFQPSPPKNSTYKRDQRSMRAPFPPPESKLKTVIEKPIEHKSPRKEKLDEVKRQRIRDEYHWDELRYRAKNEMGNGIKYKGGFRWVERPLIQQPISAPIPPIPPLPETPNPQSIFTWSSLPGQKPPSTPRQREYHPTCSTLTIIPSLDKLCKLPLEQLQKVSNFSASNIHGSITFQGTVNLIAKDIDEMIRLNSSQIEVGFELGLKGQCIVKFKNYRGLAGKSAEEKRVIIERAEELCKKDKLRMLSLDWVSGELVVKKREYGGDWMLKWESY